MHDTEPRVGKGQTLVPRKRPHLARAGRDHIDERAPDDDNDAARHDGGPALAPRGAVQHLDERLVCLGRRGEQFAHVPDDHADSDEHHEAHGPIGGHAEDHGPGQRLGRVAQLLGHVSGRVDAHHGERRAEQADEAGETRVSPAAAVGESEEDVGGRSVLNARQVAEDQERDQDGEEAGYVDKQHNVLKDGELAVEEDVEKQAQGQKGDGHRRRVPPLRVVSIRVVENDEGLDQLRRDEGHARDGHLPREHAEPADRVAEEALARRGRELAHPVVLTARRGRHGRHLGHGDGRRHDAAKGYDVHPDHAARPAVDEPEHAYAQDPLPHARQDHDEAEYRQEAEVAAQLLALSHPPHVAHVGLRSSVRAMNALCCLSCVFGKLQRLAVSLDSFRGEDRSDGTCFFVHHGDVNGNIYGRQGGQ